MLVTLGARDRTEDLVDLLAACHRRIRHHVVLARRLAAEGREAPAEEVRDTASQIRRYFALALPLHVADEDETIAPHLVHAGDEVTSALRALEADHARHEPLIDRVVALCDVVEHDPARMREVEAELARIVDTLAAELADHLELEERVVFPALRQLPPAARAELAAAIRRRREVTLPEASRTASPEPFARDEAAARRPR